MLRVLTLGGNFMYENEVLEQNDIGIIEKHEYNFSIFKKLSFAFILLLLILVTPLPVFAGNMHVLIMNGRKTTTKSAAESFYNLIKDTKIPQYQVSKSNIHKLYDGDPNKVTTDKIISEIKGTFSNSCDDDLNIVYFCGHGGPTGGNEGHIYFGEQPDAKDLSIQMSHQQLLQTLLSYKGKFLVIIDSCDAGRIVKAADSFTGSSRKSLESRFAFIYTTDTDASQFGSKFSGCLAEAARNDAASADANSDGCLSISELVNAANQRLYKKAWLLHNQATTWGTNQNLNLKLIQLSHIKINNTLSLKKGKTGVLPVEVDDSAWNIKTTYHYKYLSSNHSIATVDDNGNITPKAVGKITITVYLTDSAGHIYYGTEAKCVVTVSQSAQSIKFKTASKTLYIGQTFALKLSTKIKGVKYVSSNKDIATVDKNGKVTAKNTGTVNIGAKVNGKQKAVCRITVKKPFLKLNKSKATIKMTQSKTLQLKVTVKGASNKVTWTSSNKSIATVSKTGKVTAKKIGTCKITAKANGVSATCKITVNAKKTGITVKVNSTLSFGHYPQYFNIDDEPITWRVLSVEGNYALLISEDILDCQPYNTTFTEVTWETCSLRKWLNSTFMNKAFSSSDKKKLVKTLNDNKNDSGLGGNSTYDYVFLISYNDYKKYGSLWNSTAYATEYANKYTGNKLPHTYEYTFANVEYNGRKTSSIVYLSCYWMRTTSENSKGAYKYARGTQNLYYSWKSYSDGISVSTPLGVRPVIRVDLSKW